MIANGLLSLWLRLGMAKQLLIASVRTVVQLTLLGYILLGTVAIKRGRTPMTRGLAALAAIVVFVYIMGTAMTKDPWFFLPL